MATMAMTGAMATTGCAVKTTAVQSSSFWGDKAQPVKASATTRFELPQISWFGIVREQVLLVSVLCSSFSMSMPAPNCSQCPPGYPLLN